jgi:hypothetical protein
VRAFVRAWVGFALCGLCVDFAWRGVSIRPIIFVPIRPIPHTYPQRRGRGEEKEGKGQGEAEAGSSKPKPNILLGQEAAMTGR